MALLFAGSMWFYVQKVLIPYQEADAAAHGRPRGNLSDLYPRWLGARELLLHHRDPYSPEITREIQSGYYGRPLDPNRTDDPKDQQGFAYPVHVVFLLAPTIGLPFPVVQSGFRWLLVILTLASVPLWLRVLHWRPSRTVIAVLVILTFGSFAVVQGIKLQQLSLVVSALMAAAAAALVAGHLALAGFLLALATIKPQLALPMAAWLVLWAISDWRQRGRFVWSLGLTTAVLLAASEFILPGWMGRFREAVAAYRQYTGGAGSLLEVLTTPMLGRVLAYLAVLAVAVTGWYVRRAPRRFCRLQRHACFGPGRNPGDRAHVRTLQSGAAFARRVPDCRFVEKSVEPKPAHSGRMRSRRDVRVLAVAGILRLDAGIAVLPAASVQRAWAAPLYTSLGIPLAVLGLFSMCARDALRASTADLSATLKP